MSLSSASAALPRQDIVLLGAGHTNAHILRMWRMNPLPETRLTCVSNHSIATYSGMLSGVLAGQYLREQMEIDLVRLCASCQVRFIQADTTGLELASRALLLKNRPPLPFDALSVGIGSHAKTLYGNDVGLSIKPMQTFLPRLEQALEDQLSQGDKRKLRVAVIGGGAAGVEIACCLPNYLGKLLGSRATAEYTLVERHGELLSGMPKRTQVLALRALRDRQVDVKLNHKVHSAEPGCLLFENNSSLPVDLIVWATSATAHGLLAKFGLPLDERGFLLTRNTLQSLGCEAVFAVGDAGTVENTEYAKAGVYAVRQAPVLWKNLRYYLAGKPLQQWQPQESFLKILNTGDGQAIATYRGWSAHATWCWELKNWIDTRFIEKYQDYATHKPMENSSKQIETPMQCGGCGCKVPASVLAESLPKISNARAEHVMCGIDAPDDAAILKHGDGDSTAVSTDFFTAFLDDPYLMGRIAALNALNDLHAKGVAPQSALAIAVLPPGPLSQQSQLLKDLLAGAAYEFQESQVAIVGGHTIEGSQLTFGFTLLGDALAANFLRNSTPAVSNKLILTKPLGTGVLLAAHMRAECRAEWWEPLLRNMLQSNLAAAQAAQRLGASAATDVSGFGLAGHLYEMLAPRNLSATLELSSLPLLPGTSELLQQGVESTLAPGNRESFAVRLQSTRLAPLESLLYDPQTSGGLLIAIAQEKAAEFLEACGPSAAIIGTIHESSESGSRIHIYD